MSPAIRPTNPKPGSDPLHLMTDAEYAQWLEDADRRPATEEERREILEMGEAK